MPSDAEYPIPQTDALKQVNRKSLQELFSLGPEDLDKNDLEQTILAMQDLRERLSVTTEKVRQVRVKKDPTPGRVVGRVVTDPSDLGF